MTDPAADRTVADVTCLACGCLCDDIAVRVVAGRVVAAERACDRGAAWFLADRGPTNRPEATIGGKPAAREQAIERAVAILDAARAPLLIGLSGSTIETQAAAVDLADRLGGLAEPAQAPRAFARLEALARAGRVSATLGELRNRADVVLFWEVDPATSHPRFFERFLDPPGRFVPGGRAGRTLIAAGPGPSPTSALADEFWRVDPGRAFETLSCLRAFVRGVGLDAGQVERATGLASKVLSGWAGRLMRARYGAIVVGGELGLGRCGPAVVEAVNRLVADLNSATRFVAIGLGGPGNPAGAEAVLAWQTGHALAVDFGPGFPRSLVPETSAADRLARGEADAVLFVGDPGLIAEWPEEARRALGDLPSVLIAPAATEIDAGWDVAIDAARPGIEAGGTVQRSDGVSLPLRPPLEPDRPTEDSLISAIRARLADRSDAPATAGGPLGGPGS